MHKIRVLRQILV